MNLVSALPSWVRLHLHQVPHAPCSINTYNVGRMPSFLFYEIITTDSTQTKVICTELCLIPIYVSCIYQRILFSPGHPFWFIFFNFLCAYCHQHEHMSLFLTSYYNISRYPITKLLLFPILLLHSSTNLRQSVCIPNILSFLCVCWRGGLEVNSGPLCTLGKHCITSLYTQLLPFSLGPISVRLFSLHY